MEYSGLFLDHNYDYWDNIARKTPVGQDYDSLLAEHYRRAHLDLISGWTVLSAQQAVLKTDLFAEAKCPSRSFSWEILRRCNHVIGIDISPEICLQAEQRSTNLIPGKSLDCVSCDLRKLPFTDGTFDLIISDSTLDHYKVKQDIIIALRELKRVLKPGGTMIITMDNGSNFTEPLFRLWIFLGLAPFYIGKTYRMKELQKALTGIGLEIVNTDYLIHNPRFFTKLIIAIFRRISPRKCERWIKRSLSFFDGLNKRSTRSLTAQYIAVKPVKPLN
jgi:ubiquinone/menaquinone biosynthesis C-methylase UbiE